MRRFLRSDQIYWVRIPMFLIFIGYIFCLLASNALGQTEWTRYAGSPVFDVGTAGSWDADSVWGCTVLFDDIEYKMWYSGYDGSIPKRYRIGYATSPNGIIWTRHSSDPVLDVGTSGDWDNSRVSGPTVIFDGTEYKMWYHGYDGSRWRIGCATSGDGITWQKYSSNPVINLGGTWDSFHVFAPNVIFDGGVYKMWYSGDDNSNNRIGYATSTDGYVWSKYWGNPILDVGASEAWDGIYSHTASVVLFDGNMYQMWYAGVANHSPSYGRFGYATSADGLTWDKYPENPVLDVGASGAWDEDGVSYPAVLFDGFQYQMWYTGSISDPKIGYAISVVAIEVSIDIKPGSDPNAVNPKSKGVIPVAILSNEDFDATTVDGSTVLFVGASPLHDDGHLKDVDDDGDMDWVGHFKVQDTSIVAGDVEAALTGETISGESIGGADAIKVAGVKPAPSLNARHKLVTTWASVKSK